MVCHPVRPEKLALIVPTKERFTTARLALSRQQEGNEIDSIVICQELITKLPEI